MADYFDSLETRTPAEREAALLAALARQVAHAQAHAPYFAEVLCDVDPRDLTSRAALAALPVTRKSELTARQRTAPPLGGLNATPIGGLRHVFQSPGPIHEPDGHADDWWRIARAMFAAGFRAGELVYNTFSYHFTPAGMMMESGAHRLGCCVFPAGVGQTESQVQAMAALQPSAYAGTPSFLKLLIERGAELGMPCASLSKALVTGEACPPPLRAWLQDHGVTVRQMYGTADVGLIAYETEGGDGWVVDEGVLVEIVEPGGTQPMPEGETGEVVVTVLGNGDYPLIRFGTGDLSAIVSDSSHRASPCGRTNIRLKGWLGRADQTTKVKGMFVHPGQVADVVRRHPEIRAARLVVTGMVGADTMTLHCDATREDDGLAHAIADSIRDVMRLRGEVRFVAAGSLPQDGKVIEDARSYD
ncbi:phenylacetate-CoA ligase [Cupriavidus sp. OV038]|jgi:phenylacetate-CoA ligase|uniref:phenylacetate--CoA ligase family protein n=1 Tax=unclassified Cupriavidus TaxID=2640874 RepID=UPI0008EFBFC3|nr:MULTISPECIES: AMP-binding protein [unclassified Cupriavidus]SFC78723.1 phenylacetate-CoA ligase [Cupriavidus sp. OV038]SFO76732.1 phenylacetate-CoA ligase [Cupriavidus sp. OV096]